MEPQWLLMSNRPYGPEGGSPESEMPRGFQSQDAPMDMERDREPQVQPGPALRRIRILVADDERRIRLALRTCLEAEGYDVDEAADGNEALDLVLRRAGCDDSGPGNAKSGWNPDACRTSGHPRAAQATGHCAHSLGFLSGGAEDPEVRRSAFLEKPLVPESLRWTVRKVLSEYPHAVHPGEIEGNETGPPRNPPGEQSP